MIAALAIVLAIVVAFAWAPSSRRIEDSARRHRSTPPRSGRTSMVRPAPRTAGRGLRRADRLREEVNEVEVLDLLAAALGSGASLPRALEAVGEASGGEFGAAMTSVTGSLAMGASWDQAWAKVGVQVFGLEKVLEPAWSGAPARALVARAAERARRSEATRAAEAAQRLGVILVLPLGLCFLPAFILITVAPVVISLVSGLM